MTFKIVESHRITNTVIDSNIDNYMNFNIVILCENRIKSINFIEMIFLNIDCLKYYTFIPKIT